MKLPILTLVAFVCFCLASWALSQSPGSREMPVVATQPTPPVSMTRRDPVMTHVVQGDIAGTVVDQDGAVISGVKVVLESPAVGRRVTVTAEDGSFRFTNLPPAGNYRLRFSREGFTVAQHWVRIEVGRSTELNVTMAFGGPLPTPSYRPTPRPTASLVPSPSPMPSPWATPFPSPRPSTIPSPLASPTASQAPSPALSPSPAATPNNSGNPDWDALVTAEVQKLHDSKIVFNPPAEMRQGAKERIEARISFADIGPALVEGLQGRGVPQVENLKVGPIMKVVLIGDQDAFRIEKFSSEEQTVAGKPFAQWEWDVTPLHSGNQTLHLQATASIYVPGRGEKPVDIPVIHKTVRVKVDSWYATKRFVGNNWQWLWTALFIPLGGWLWQRKRKTKRRAAGFR